MKKRRRFLRNSTLLMTYPLFNVYAKGYAKTTAVLHEPYQSIALVYDDLFPASAGTPGSTQLNTVGYLRGVMQDERIAQEEKVFIFNGAKWLNEESLSMYDKKYYLLSSPQRQKVLLSVSYQTWGDNWLYTLMGYLFESMLCDPIYGANIDHSGWKWLDYEPGFPRPLKVVS